MSASRPKLISIDAFSKTIEDAKVKTALGGIITLLCVAVVMFLIRNEYNDYIKIENLPSLVVDRDINKPLDINFDITFPNIPCGVLTVDILDSLGDAKLDVLKLGFQQFDLIDGKEVAIDLKDNPTLSNNLDLDLLTKSGPDSTGKCGSCYGSLPQENNENCCNNCASIKLAYAQKQWAFYDGENIDQCEQEGYVQKLQESITKNYGCRIKGTTQINRLAGNLHFAPGSSLTSPGQHTHDLSLYNKHENKFNFDHIINEFLFGPPPAELSPQEELTHPLNGFRKVLNSKQQVFLYYLKIVATRFEYLNGGYTDTNQFLVIAHDRPLAGGRDGDHQHTIHAKGGMPGLFFYFDISPMKIINKQQYAKSWSGFVLGVLSSIAGVLMVGTLLDRSVFVAEQAIRLKKDI